MSLSAEALALSTKPAGVETIAITSREQWLALRERDVTASVAGAILGVNPYLTYWGLWMRKASRIAADAVASDPEFSADGDEVTLPPAGRGHMRERETVEMLGILRPDWRLSYPLGAYWRHASLRLGATPDLLAVDPRRPGFGVVQIKSVAPHVYVEQWTDPDTREIIPPLWIPVQAIQEAKLTGASWAAVAVHRENYGGRPTVRLIDVPLHQGLWSRLVADVDAFWLSIDAAEAPHPDFKRDAEGIMRLYADAAAGVVDLDGDKAERAAALIAEREALKAKEAEGGAAEKARRPLDAELIWIMGNAEACRLPGGRIVRAPTQRRVTLDAERIKKEMGVAWAAERSKTSTFRTITLKEGAAA